MTKRYNIFESICNRVAKKNIVIIKGRILDKVHVLVIVISNMQK